MEQNGPSKEEHSSPSPPLCWLLLLLLLRSIFMSALFSSILFIACSNADKITVSDVEASIVACTIIVEHIITIIIIIHL